MIDASFNKITTLDGLKVITFTEPLALVSIH